MGDEGQLIQLPLEGQNLAEYLQQLPDHELHRIVSNSELLTLFCRKLQECFGNLERVEDSLENLYNIIKRVNDFEQLHFFVKRLIPVRQSVLECLTSTGNEIENISKLCTLGRFVGSSVDILGTVIGLQLTKWDSSYASLAFRAATSFGLLGLASTFGEMAVSKQNFEELMKKIQRDQELFAPIQLWYKQTNELEDAMKAVFRFDVTNDIVLEFRDRGEEEFTPVRLLATLLRSIAEQGIENLRDDRLIRNLINFTLYPESQDWCEWIIFRRHPIMMDITRIALQLQSSPLQFLLCQSLPALHMQDQSIGAFPVWGRIALNCVSIYDALRSLRSPEISPVAAGINHLREHLASELAALKRIVDFVQLRNEHNQRP